MYKKKEEDEGEQKEEENVRNTEILKEYARVHCLLGNDNKM